MNDLDDVSAMRKADPSEVLASTSMFADQLTQAWEESQKVVFPENYRRVKNIVVVGMGGSRFTPKIIGTLYRDIIKIPYEICDDYTVPGYVNSDSLVIFSSYSGTTEEPLSAREDARKKGAKIAGVAKKGNFIDPGYYFNPIYNPCGQPRIGGGYLLMGHLGILKNLGFVEIDDKIVIDAISFTRQLSKKYMANVISKNNFAKKLAMLLKDKHPFIITAEFLKGFGNAFANQINETAKNISDVRFIPELNHHLLEGLSNPKNLHLYGIFIFILSDYYSEPIKKRFMITKDVVEKQKVATCEIKLTGPNTISQALEALTLSSYVTYYMAMLSDVDPVAIPWVDYFKSQLAK